MSVMLDILFVDDDPALRIPVGGALRQEGHQVTIARDGAEAMAELDRHAFDVVVTDVRMPKVDGLTILRRLRKEAPSTSVILVTAFGTVAQAVEAMRDRAVDYICKPFESEQLLLLLRRIAERLRLERELTEARAQMAALSGRQVLVGRSPTFARLRETIEVVARSEAAVLITGESGTGKELAARLLHDESPRAKGPFVAINCAAFPESLLEAELFGHERGAFTGAVKSRDGRFKAADGGTLFLDEVVEMPLGAQAKLLRVLQSGVFQPIGTNANVSVDVRVVSATNKDLKQLIAEGRFREDLYFRIKVLELRLPPLREREGDLPLLVEHILLRLSAPAMPPRLTQRAWQVLRAYRFPGNVRELEHALEHALVLSRGADLDLEHLPADLRADAPSKPAPTAVGRPLAEAAAEFEREYLMEALRASGGNRGRAAAALGISRKSLWQKLRAYGLGEEERA